MKVVKTISYLDKPEWVLKGFIPLKEIKSFMQDCGGRCFITIEKSGKRYYKLSAFETSEDEFKNFQAMLEHLLQKRKSVKVKPEQEEAG